MGKLRRKGVRLHFKKPALKKGKKSSGGTNQTTGKMPDSEKQGAHEKESVVKIGVNLLTGECSGICRELPKFERTDIAVAG